MARSADHEAAQYAVFSTLPHSAVNFALSGPCIFLKVKQSKGVPRQAEVALGVPGRLTL